MHLHALDLMVNQQRPPAFVDFPAVRQEHEIPLDHAGKAICFGTTQAEAVLVERAGGNIPKLGQGLGGVAEPRPLSR
jgi:hypothetical protein